MIVPLETKAINRRVLELLSVVAPHLDDVIGGGGGEEEGRPVHPGH
jgi:hypothetical protein